MSADEQPTAVTTIAASDAESDTKTIANNPEVERSEKILKAKELYSVGSRNFLVRSYAESADELSQVCALYEDLYGELSDELGMPYLLYAKSLIALALDENKVIDVPDEEDDDDDDEGAVEEDGGDDDNDEVADIAAVDGVDAIVRRDADEAAIDDAAAAAEAEAAAKPTNGTAAATPTKLETITEVEVDKKVDDNEVDSTENVVEKQAVPPSSEKEVQAQEEKPEEGKPNAAKSDEAMVTSTAEESVGGVANGSATAADTADDIDVDADKPSTSNGAANAEEEDDENEAASSLQLAWEILELAAKIFSRQGLSGLPNLAEVQTELANIEFENNILDAARDDYEKALKIYAELPNNYRRAMAEIHYKIGLIHLMQQQNKEGAAALKEACTLIDDEINVIKAKTESSDKDKNNIQDMEETKQEIWAKIAEIEEMQAQQVADVRAALKKVINPVGADGAGPSSSSSSATAAAASSSATGNACSSTAAISSSPAITSSSTSSKPTDISHLIKRKKPEEPSSEAEAAAASPAKRAAV